MVKRAGLSVLAAAVVGILALCNAAFSSQLHVPGTYGTIQDAIDAAIDGDVVVVADGVYTGTRNKNLDFGGRSITVRSENGPENCIIDCQGNGRGFYFHSGEDENSVLAGLSIINGYVTPSHFRPRGGGILCENSSPTIDNCILKANKTDGGSGGGIAIINQSQTKILNCIFLQNIAKEGSDGDGAGMLISGSDVLVKNCLFSGNRGGYMGGGGGIRHYAASSLIVNCTFVGNYAGYCGGVISSPNCSTTLINCILWGNDGWWTKELGGDRNSHTTVINCDIRGGISGTRHTGGSSITDGGGNINADPMFVTGPLGGYYLSQVLAGQGSNSPCLDAGSDTASALGMDIYSTRTDGVPDSNIVDLGYHYPQPSPYLIAVSKITSAANRKLELLEGIDAALQDEQEAYRALEKLIETKDYDGLKKGDIVKAKQKIHSAIQHEVQSADAIDKSIEKLDDALSVLGYELPPLAARP